MIGLAGYLAFLADSDLFGILATISLVVAISGLFKRTRESKYYSVLVFLCLLFMPALHAIGSYFLNRPPA